MKWYSIDENFLDFLRAFENRIPVMSYGPDKFKPFFGALFEIGDLVYVTQVSSPKARHDRMKNSPDFIKLFDKNRLIAVVNLNYMFPVHKSELIGVEYGNIDEFRTFKDDQAKSDYITLLKREMKQIQQKSLGSKAEKLYNLKYDYPDNFVSKRCFDFKKLENKCIEYQMKDTNN